MSSLIIIIYFTLLQFIKDTQTVGSSMSITLQGMESKALLVVFAPYFTGAMAGKIIFSYYTRNAGVTNGPKKTVSNIRNIKRKTLCWFQFFQIQLYGYGGMGKLDISNALKDPNGQMWLSLGTLNSEGILSAQIKLHNSGDLTNFTKVKLIPKGLFINYIYYKYVN